MTKVCAAANAGELHGQPGTAAGASNAAPSSTQ